MHRIYIPTLYTSLYSCSSISELTECSENAARKTCGNEAAKFTHQLVEKYTSSLTKVSSDITSH